MPVQTKETLKSYFENGKEPNESKYVDLIDTMGDMYKGTYDTDGDGKVDFAESVPWGGVTERPLTYPPSIHTHGGGDITSAVANANAAPWTGITGKPSTYPATTPVADSSKLGNVAAAEYIQRVSATRPGVNKLYRFNSDTAHWLQTDWTGTYWLLQGYTTTGFHGGVQVAYADLADNSNKLGNVAASAYLKLDTDISTAGDFRTTGGLSVGSSYDGPAGRIYLGSASLYIANNGSGDMFRISNGNGSMDIAKTSNGYSTYNTGGSGHIFNGHIIAGDIVQSGVTGVYATYAGNRSTNALRLWKDATNARIDTNYPGTEAIWIGYNSAGYTRTTRIGNGNSGYGDIHADNFVNESTRASKRNIRSLKASQPNALALVAMMEPVKFQKKNGGDPDKNKERIGFIAEDLLPILPEAVKLDENGKVEGITYSDMIPLLVQAIQELKEQIEELKR